MLLGTRMSISLSSTVSAIMASLAIPSMSPAGLNDNTLKKSRTETSTESQKKSNQRLTKWKPMTVSTEVEDDYHGL
jgi:hypothetical protein